MDIKGKHKKLKRLQRKKRSTQKLYVVEKITGVLGDHGIKKCCVKWEGYRKETWEPVENLSNCQELIDEYLAASVQSTSANTLQLTKPLVRWDIYLYNNYTGTNAMQTI